MVDIQYALGACGGLLRAVSIGGRWAWPRSEARTGAIRNVGRKWAPKARVSNNIGASRAV